MHNYFNDKILLLAKTEQQLRPCPILIVHLGLWLPALVLWLAAEKYIFHTLLRGNAWEYLNKAGQAILIKQAPACSSPSVLSYYIYIHVFIIFAK